MEYYNRFMQRYEPDMWYNVSGAMFNKISKEMQVKEDNTDSEDGEAEPYTDDMPITPDNSVVKDHLVHTSEMRKTAMEKKNERQEERAKQALKQCGKAAVESGVSPGAVVTLQVDYKGLVATVYAVLPKTGGVKVCCEHGVITHDGSKGVYWVPADKYSMNAPAGMYLPLPEKLAEVWKKVEYGLFDEINVQGSLLARFNFRLRQIVQSRNQRGVIARKETVWPIFDAGGRNSAATVRAPAMVTVEDEVGYI